MRTPLYLRDLNDRLIAEQLEIWKARGRTGLIKAYEADKDITIGHYLTVEEIEGGDTD